MGYYTVLPSGLGFYGGITLAYGVGIHEDWDPTIKMGEPFRADYINILEQRVHHLENVVNQIEMLLLYPSGHINGNLNRDSDPASGLYYHNTNHSILASGVNRLVEVLGAGGYVTPLSLPGYPYSVGTIE